MKSGIPVGSVAATVLNSGDGCEPAKLAGPEPGSSSLGKTSPSMRIGPSGPTSMMLMQRARFSYRLSAFFAAATIFSAVGVT